MARSSRRLARGGDADRQQDLYPDRPGKAWSLTDCLSFVVMENRRLAEALTTDHHFEPS